MYPSFSSAVFTVVNSSGPVRNSSLACKLIFMHLLYNNQFCWSALVSTRIRIQIHVFDDQKLGKIYSWKKIYIFWPKKNCNLLIPRPPQRTFKLQEKTSSLEREYLALQNLNFLHFCGSILPSWIRIRICIPNADPDLYSQCGSGSSQPKWMRIRTDPDPQHW